MNGLILVTGINGTGKSTVTKLIQEVAQNYGSDAIEVRSASRLMRELGGSLTYEQLSEMNVDARNALRQESFCVIRDLALQKLVFLDAHFVFEDGERVDFTPLMECVKEVIVVEADTQVVFNRMLGDIDTADHIGRIFLLGKGLEFITAYQQSEWQEVELFCKNASEGGYNIKVSRIINNEGLQELSSTVTERMYEILSSLRDEILHPEGLRSWKSKEK